MVELRRINLPLPGLDGLVAESAAEGFQFLTTLQAEWQSGANRFSQPGEGLFGAFEDGILIAVGGLSRDPFLTDPTIGRIRRIYVQSSSRGTGVGTQLMRFLIAEARLHFRRVRLSATSPAAARIYEKLGFEPIPGPDATHALTFEGEISMSELALTAEEMLAWNERTTFTWRTLTEQHPEILALQCDIYGVRTVGQLLQHIVAVETRYAQRLSGVTETPYDAIPYTTPAEIFAAHDVAMQTLRDLVAKGNWESKLEFQTISMGRVRSSRKTLFFHALLHSIRHYAQLATLVRQHGYKPGTPMDYMMMGAEMIG